jgi:hypothetical protein
MMVYEFMTEIQVGWRGFVPRSVWQWIDQNPKYGKLNNG